MRGLFSLCLCQELDSLFCCYLILGHVSLYQKLRNKSILFASNVALAMHGCEGEERVIFMLYLG